MNSTPLPPGYELEWGGEYESSTDAQAALAGKLPVVGLLIVLTVIFGNVAVDSSAIGEDGRLYVMDGQNEDVYVYERDLGGADNWGQLKKIKEQ